MVSRKRSKQKRSQSEFLRGARMGPPSFGRWIITIASKSPKPKCTFFGSHFLEIWETCDQWEFFQTLFSGFDWDICDFVVNHEVFAAKPESVRMCNLTLMLRYKTDRPLNDVAISPLYCSESVGVAWLYQRTCLRFLGHKHSIIIRYKPSTIQLLFFPINITRSIQLLKAKCRCFCHDTNGTNLYGQTCKMHLLMGGGQDAKEPARCFERSNIFLYFSLICFTYRDLELILFNSDIRYCATRCPKKNDTYLGWILSRCPVTSAHFRWFT